MSFNDLFGSSNEALQQVFGNAQQQQQDPLGAISLAASLRSFADSARNMYAQQDDREFRNMRNLRLWRARFNRDPLADCEAR